MSRYEDEEDEYEDLKESEFILDVSVHYRNRQGEMSLTIGTEAKVDLEHPVDARTRAQGVIDFLVRSIPVASLSGSEGSLLLDKEGQIFTQVKPSSGKRRRRRRRGGRERGENGGESKQPVG